MSGPVFINYRRSISEASAVRMSQALVKTFGKKGVFLDLRGLEGGEHWLNRLEREVDTSSAVLVLLDHGWVDVVDARGQRRLLDPHDFVRFEIARGLTRGIPVLPVLLNGAPMPDVNMLPPNLMQLAFAQAMGVREKSFEEDIALIAARLQSMIAASRRSVLSWRRTMAAAFVAFGTGLASGVVLPRQEWLVGADPRLDDLRMSNVSLEKNLANLQKKDVDTQNQLKRRSDELEGLKPQFDMMKDAAEGAFAAEARVLWLEANATPADRERLEAITIAALAFIGTAEAHRSGVLCRSPEITKNVSEFARAARAYFGGGQIQLSVRLAIAAAAAGDTSIRQDILAGATKWKEPFRKELQTWLKQFANNNGSADGIIEIDGPAARSFDALMQRFSSDACVAQLPSTPTAVPINKPPP